MRQTLTTRRVLVLTGLLLFSLAIVGCNRNDPTMTAAGLNYTQWNLVADNSGFYPPPSHIDPNMLNGWGLVMDGMGNFGVAANHSGMGLFYDGDGNATLSPIMIPPLEGPGAPAGQVYNSTSEFMIPGTSTKSQFIYSTEDGTICAGVPGTTAVVVAGPLDDGAVYKGLALAMHGGRPYLYATNFGDHRIDVFNGSFQRVMSFPFRDPTIPDDYSPFSIANIDGKLYISYAIPKPPDFHDDTAGPGHGIINIFNPNGILNRRFYAHGVLNSPWGITMAPEEFGGFRKMILIGNFGDGKVNVFDNSGKFKGNLMSGDEPLVIDGLWALGAMPGHGMDRVYFTAGPNHEADGLFGYLSID